MTPAEVVRHIECKNRTRQIEMQERASYDYIQAQLIVKGIAITLGSKDAFPTIYQVYPGVFDELQEAQEEKIAQQKAELSALRFKQFAHSYNKRYENKEVPISE